MPVHGFAYLDLLNDFGQENQKTGQYAHGKPPRPRDVHEFDPEIVIMIRYNIISCPIGSCLTALLENGRGVQTPMTEAQARYVPAGQKWDLARQVARRLENAGFQAVFVGGCVRDHLLGRTIHDIDIASNARPEDVMALFPKVVPTGLQHGTVTVVVEGQAFEVTTFRQETGYVRHRWPQVTFVDQLDADLSRRDFTINAMALSADGRLFDPYGGQGDLRSRLIRAVGDPHRRFTEDALRMLRAIRFAAQLGFEIESRTWEAIVCNAPLLGEISLERIQHELHRTLQSDHPDKGMWMLQESGLKRHIGPLAETADWTPERLQSLRMMTDAAGRWALLLLPPSPSPNEHSRCVQRASDVLCGLKYSRKMMAAVKTCMALYRALEEGKSVRELLLDHRDEEVQEAVRLYAAVYRWPEGRLQEQLDAALAASRQLVIRSPDQMAVDGHDLQAAVGEPPGPWMKQLIRQLYEEVAFGQLPNEKGAILARAGALFGTGQLR